MPDLLVLSLPHPLNTGSRALDGSGAAAAPAGGDGAAAPIAAATAAAAAAAAFNGGKELGLRIV
jgi:hypothetical protein